MAIENQAYWRGTIQEKNVRVKENAHFEGEVKVTKAERTANQRTEKNVQVEWDSLERQEKTRHGYEPV